jgi:amidase
VKAIRRAFGDTFDRSRLNNLTLGLDRYARRNMHRLPVAIMRLRTVRRRTAQFFGAYDAVLTPTVADETPRLGHLDPTADSQQIIDRQGNWGAFTPLQNVTARPLSHCRWPSRRAVCQWA